MVFVNFKSNDSVVQDNHAILSHVTCVDFCQP